jgi:hypothetical protein
VFLVWYPRHSLQLFLLVFLLRHLQLDLLNLSPLL